MPVLPLSTYGALWMVVLPGHKLVLTLLLPLLVLLWATESTKQRATRLRSYGWSQQRIADHMQISRYRVRQVLA